MSETSEEPRPHPLLALEGRVGRGRYLAFFVAAFLVYTIVMPLAAICLASLKAAATPIAMRVPYVVAIVLGVPAAIALLYLFFVSISFATRRFHDMNLRGNWNWLIVFLPFLPIPNLPQVWLPFVLPKTSFLLWHAMLVLVPGTPGRNRYGPPPGEPDHADVAAVFDAPDTERPRATRT